MKIQKKADETFVVEFNGLPFHVTPEYPPAELYGEQMTYNAIRDYAEAYPENVTGYVWQDFPTPEISETQKIKMLEQEAQSLVPAIQAGIDADFEQAGGSGSVRDTERRRRTKWIGHTLYIGR